MTELDIAKERIAANYHTPEVSLQSTALWLVGEVERLREQKITRQSQVYHAMKLVDRMNGKPTCDETFMADVDRALRRANRIGPPEAAKAAGGES